MKRLAIIAATGLLALFLTACEDKSSSQPAADTSATTEQTDQNAAKADDNGEKKGTEAQPSTEGESH